jgi:hypothetical protein
MVVWEVVKHHQIYHQRLCETSQVCQSTRPLITGTSRVFQDPFSLLFSSQFPFQPQLGDFSVLPKFPSSELVGLNKSVSWLAFWNASRAQLANTRGGSPATSRLWTYALGKRMQMFSLLRTAGSAENR